MEYATTPIMVNPTKPANLTTPSCLRIYALSRKRPYLKTK